MKKIEFVVEAQDVLTCEMNTIMGGVSDETAPCSPGGNIECYRDGVKKDQIALSII